MSHVFVAEEKAFGRRIVVKILPQETKADVSVERFKREIKVAARLQHPHIVPVLTAGELNGVPYYTMPFVKGESLRARLARSGELSVNEAVHYLRDVAAALAYAHSEGVVHRDIKPDNVIVSGGVAVVTDFGVSKAVDVAATEGDHPTTGITSLGVALGTPAYMAPEQASADPRVDHRADIYSFGCLAYELLAGSSPFAGRPPQQMLAAHVTDPPEPLLRRRPQMPPGLAQLIMKCLEKRPGDRPQTAEEIVATLDAIATPSGGMAPTDQRLPAVRRSRMPWLLGIAGLAAVLIAGLLFFLRPSALKPYSVGETVPVAVGPELESLPAISPDGKLVAYQSFTPNGYRIFVRQIDGGRATMLTNEVEGDYKYASWSPDGSRIAFSANDAIYIIPSLTGGSPKRTIENGQTSSWSRDGRQIVYSNPDGLFVYDLTSAKSSKVAAGGFHHSPALSPDGRLVAYVVGRYPRFNNLSANSIFIAPITGGVPIRISDSTHVNLSPAWAPDGRSLLYVSNLGGTRDVFQQTLSSNGDPSGKPQRITTSLGSFRITVSSDGSRMAYDAVRNNSNIYQIDIGKSPKELVQGKPVTRQLQHVEAMDLSHDGNWLVYDSDLAGNSDIYKIRLDGGDPVQLTTNSAGDFAPSWSPDDKTIAFHSNRNGTRDIYIINNEGNDEQQVTSGAAEDYDGRFLADGRHIHFRRESDSPRSVSLEIVSRMDATKWSAPRRLVSYPFGTGDQRSSPDGSLIAFTGGQNVELISVSTGERRVVISDTALKGFPQGLYWARDGKSLYVETSARKSGIWQVPLNGGAPRLLLTDSPDGFFGRWLFATDGKRLFYTRAAWEADVWVMGLKTN
jgi:serine/threonine-protein kinase